MYSLLIDGETEKPKGYGFCEYENEELKKLKKTYYQ